MFTKFPVRAVFRQSKIFRLCRRNVQVSVVGAANEIGSNVALLAKHNCRISKLKLCDEDEKVEGIAQEMRGLPIGPLLDVFTGPKGLSDAVADSKIIVYVARNPPESCSSKGQMLDACAPGLLQLCQAMTERNPDAFLVISCNPLNCVLPLVSTVLSKCHSYNPYKVFGVTQLDSARSTIFAADVLKANPRHLFVPVIGGHSEETVVPLYSNLEPKFYHLTESQADRLTRLVRTPNIVVQNYKVTKSTPTTAVAWAVNEFIEALTTAVSGKLVDNVHCFTANPHFGTRYFAGPNTIGPTGLVQACSSFEMDARECKVLTDSIRALNEDIMFGEDYAHLKA